MGVEKVKRYFVKHGIKDRVVEFNVSCATVTLAANALNVEVGRIAKTLSFKHSEGCILIVCSGDKLIDNKKYKDQFGVKAKMLTPDEVIFYTGYVIGGVCPFAIDNDRVRVYVDNSLKRYYTVFLSCGSPNSAIELTCDELFNFSNSKEWVDVVK